MFCGFPAVATGKEIFAARARHANPGLAHHDPASQPSPNFALTHSRFWRWYLALSILYPVATTCFYLLTETPPDLLVECSLLAFSLLCVIPIYGYVSQRPIRPRWLWITIFWLTALSTALAVLLIVASLVTGLAVIVFGQFVVPLVLALLYVFAVDQYLNHSPHLWNNPSPG
jgi:hypothetical protein